MSKKQRMVTDEQARALGELYVWGAIEAILEGSTAPRETSGQRAAERVLRICRDESQKLLRKYDQEPRNGQ